MILKVRTKDDRIVEVVADDMRLSGLFGVLLDSITDPEDEIPLYNVDEPVFNTILEFTQHHQVDPMKRILTPLQDGSSLGIQKWYEDYISKQHHEGLYALLEASTYLDIEPLQELICAKIASLIKGSECDELKRIFGLEYE